MEEPLDPIIIQVTVPLPVGMIFGAFLQPDQMTEWLCSGAEVDAEVGGLYRLIFSDDPPFTSAGTITHLTPDLEVGFSWEAPAQFAELMNQPGALTRVYVRLQESPEGIDITLEHDGWKSGEPWEEARSWHFHFWEGRLHRLKDYLLRAAYG